MVATALTVGGYGTSYAVESPSLLATAVLTTCPPTMLGLGVLLARHGIANPWVRKYQRWRSRASDWKRQAEQAEMEAERLSSHVDDLEDLLDEVAQYVTQADDPTVARRLLEERLEKQKAGKRRGRPPRTPNGLSYEEAVEMGRDIRKQIARGMSWASAAKRHLISVETARKRVQWANEEDEKRLNTA